MVGWLYIDAAFGSPNAHFSLRFGTSAALMPAAFASWKRAFVASALHPFQDGLFDGSANFALAPHWFGIVFGLPAGMLPIFRPPTNSAYPRLTMSLASATACACTGAGFIVMAAYTVSGDSLRSASMSGACSAPAARATPGLR